MRTDDQWFEPGQAIPGKRGKLFYNHTGMRYGRFTVLGKFKRVGLKTFWFCRCDCGAERWVWSASFKNGTTQSCGCLDRDVKKGHQKHVSKTHYMTFIWKAMINRCDSDKNPYWRDYGGRGIKVCEGWRKSSIQMLSDLGERPVGGTLERIKNNGHYSCGKCRECLESGWPKNAKWASMKEQQSNKRSNVRFSWMGRRLNSAQWAEALGIQSDRLIYNRIQRQGWSIEKAMTTPYAEPTKEEIQPA